MLDNSYFISPDGYLMPVDYRHIGTVSDYPEKFGLTREYIDTTFEKYNEKKGLEGKAREEILTKLIHEGWIRIRLYTNKSQVFWSINILDLTPQVKKYLHDFAVKAIAGVRPITKKAWGDDIVNVVSFSDGKAHTFKMKEMAEPGFVNMGNEQSETMRKYQRGNEEPYDFSVYSKLKTLRVGTFANYVLPAEKQKVIRQNRILIGKEIKDMKIALQKKMSDPGYLDRSGEKFLYYNDEFYLRQASLSSIERHTHNGFFCVSAFRNKQEATRAINIANHKKLCAEVKALGLGYITLIGGYVENQGQPDQIEVKELSILVPYRNVDHELTVEEFFEYAIYFRDKYNQDGVLFCGKDGIVAEYKRSGEQIVYGKFRVNDLARFFSDIRGRRFEYYKAGSSAVNDMGESVTLSEAYKFYGFRCFSSINDRRDYEAAGGIIPISLSEYKRLK
jgi:hypothetical protein